MDLVRPSMEAAGIDVFATARNIGWELKPIPCKNMEYGKIIHSRNRSVGLVLIEWPLPARVGAVRGGPPPEMEDSPTDAAAVLCGK